MFKHIYILLPTLLILLSPVLFSACNTDDTSERDSQSNIEQSAISLKTYIGKSESRAAINDTKAISPKGIGIYAMYTNGNKKYSITDNNFCANFMTNTELKRDSKYDASSKSGWYYSPLRFWPSASDEYISFVAYAPYNSSTTLYAKSDNTFTIGAENASYLKYEVSSDKSKMTDMLYSDITQTANMQHYSADGKTWTNTGNGFDNSDENFSVLLTLKHATARIGIDLYSSSMEGAGNVNYLDRGKFQATDGKYEYTNTRIIVNKVMLLGDNTSAENDSPTGAFYSYGYLNLGGIATDNPLWAGKSTDSKFAVTWDNSDESAIETVRGEGFFLGHQSWQQGKDNDAPSIAGNEIAGWRQNVTYDGTWYNGLSHVTEIGNAEDGYLFIVPQDFTGEDKLYCYIDYTLRYNDTGKESQHITRYAQISRNFEAGKAYTICIDIRLDEAAKFSLQVANWPEDED